MPPWFENSPCDLDVALIRDSGHASGKVENAAEVEGRQVERLDFAVRVEDRQHGRAVKLSHDIGAGIAEKSLGKCRESRDPVNALVARLREHANAEAGADHSCKVEALEVEAHVGRRDRVELQTRHTGQIVKLRSRSDIFLWRVAELWTYICIARDALTLLLRYGAGQRCGSGSQQGHGDT